MAERFSPALPTRRVADLRRLLFRSARERRSGPRLAKVPSHLFPGLCGPRLRAFGRGGSLAQYTSRINERDRKSTRLNSSHSQISYAVFCFDKKRERSGINNILHELTPLFTINVTMRDIKSKNVYSRVNSKATTQWRKTESANGVHLEGVASDNRSS